ncbi:uncharacterized protein LOC130275879 [Hyla sarda]|uniref:uncharacterized protein LOC130275879 n=1 Tax=Hyla sarda TaxID=327740 RepID=UPI0024C3C410|nr:uncharacterized protein LOC130275879 [Hyla sarda]XP_056380444.1 uncharacterized protein LOC130275879 [Hyla sarda]
MITTDSWVLNTILGYQIEFMCPPHQTLNPQPIYLSEDNKNLIDMEIKELSSKNAIIQIPSHTSGFLSNLFLVKKKDGGYRPVINLKTLNNYVCYHHFKMEGIHLLRDLLLPEDWLAKIDLKDAYLTVPMHHLSQPYLQFLWKDQKWQFTSLPFGLSSAPWCFTKLLRPVVALLRARGVRLIIYLDDILLMAQSLSRIHLHIQWTLSLFSNLGFIINMEKSILSPSKELEFLGFLINTQSALLSLPSRRLKTIRREIYSILNKEMVSLRSIARVVGLLSASIQAIFPAPLHYRALQRLKAQHLREGLGYEDEIALTPDTKEELLWWLKHLQDWNGKAIFNSVPDLIIESDASLTGWGARCGSSSTGGKWSPEETMLHINCLELLAGFFALKSFAKTRSNCCILLRMDNISAVQYINKLGGTKSLPLANIAKDFLALLSSQRHHHQSRILTWTFQHHCGLELSFLQRFQRLAIESQNIQLHQLSLGSFISGSLRIPSESPGPSLLQWASGSRSGGYRCPSPTLAPGQPLRVSSFYSDFESSSTHQISEINCGSDNPLVANPIVVPPNFGNDYRLPSSTPISPVSTSGFLRESSSSHNLQQSSIDSLVCFGSTDSDFGLSNTSREILSDAWAPGTRSAYRSAWKVWSYWCMQRDLDPVHASLEHIIKFFVFIFRSWKSVSYH